MYLCGHVTMCILSRSQAFCFFISISDVTSRSVCDSLLWKPWPILFDDKSLINLVMFRNCSKLPEGNVCFESLLCAVLPHVAS